MKVFSSDVNLRDALYLLNLSNEQYIDLCYALADGLYTYVDKFVKDNDMSANEYYESERKKRIADNTYNSAMLLAMQSVILSATGKEYTWYMVSNKPIYVGILKAILYGAVKHFFYENRYKYLPQYDWYLIEANPKRKEIMNVLFLEFDKLATISDAIQYYQDPDDIPVEFLIRLQEITGLTMNTYGNIFTADQLRNLTKHLIEIWREKGSLYSIELFFSCMGIECSAKELWFDRRLFFNPNSLNEYTQRNSIREFGYYLTPNTPQSTTYSFSGENVSYSMYTAPKTSRIWERAFKTSVESEREIAMELLGYKDSDRETIYTFFKSNYLLIDFEHINSGNEITDEELAVFKELVNHVLPIYMKTIYADENETSTGGDDWDILKTWDINESKPGDDRIVSVRDENNVVRPVDIFKLFDTQNAAGAMPDAYPSAYTGEGFVSGSYIIVNDTRLKAFVELNENYDWKSAATSGVYDLVGGGDFNSSADRRCYPLFYDDEGNGYYPGSSENELIQVTPENVITTGILVTAQEEDESNNVPYESTITRYFFQVNNSETEIFPSLFVEDNNGIRVDFIQGNVEDETFSPDLENQVDWTYEQSEETCPYETFDPQYTEEPQNLFEASTWAENIQAINDLYNNERWNGDIQYEYFECTNPIQYVEADLSSGLTITLI